MNYVDFKANVYFISETRQTQLISLLGDDDVCMTGLFRFWARLDVVAELGLDYKTCDRVIVWFMRIPTLGFPPFLKCEYMVSRQRENDMPLAGDGAWKTMHVC